MLHPPTPAHAWLWKQCSLCNMGLHMKNIMDTSQGLAQLTTFTKAVASAGLVESLNEPGPFTIFAPSDEAFSSMPAGSLNALLKDVPYLQRILQNHVVQQKYDSNHFGKLKSAHTMAGSELHVELKPKVTINRAKILKPNIVCSNGIIHIIDHVFMLSMQKAAGGQ